MSKFDNLEIKRVVAVKVWFTAKEWCLYDGPYATVIANRLNNELERYVNRGESRKMITTVMHSLMRHNEEYGANDTEPRAFLERVLDEIFKEQA